MIVKKNFNLLLVARNIRREIALVILVSAIVWIASHFFKATVYLPFSIAAILGSGLAIFIAFRNQSAYGRWWEARTAWGGIVNNSRIFARQVIANADHAVATGKATPESAAAYKQEMVYRQIAFAHALRLHLRQQKSWDELKHLLEADEYNTLLQAFNKPNVLLHRQGIRMKEAMRVELLGAFDNISMEPNLAQFSNWQGSCERIKNTPLPRNYHYFTRLFLYGFILLLPFCLLGDLSKLGADYFIIPVSFLIASVFAIMNRVGEINEDPFEDGLQDVPMTALCNTIERDLKEQLGEADLPEKMGVVQGYLH